LEKEELYWFFKEYLPEDFHKNHTEWGSIRSISIKVSNEITFPM
jgi:hypothetical protein